MDSTVLGCTAVVCANLLLKKRKKKRRWWVHPILRNRLSTGYLQTNFCHHRTYPEKFFSYYRMSVKSFHELYDLLRCRLQKKNTNMRIAINPMERLVITLRYLATGADFSALEYVFQVAKSTIRIIVRQTCVEIWTILQPMEMPQPSTELWTKIANEFQRKSDFPNCLGAIDGKHIRIVCPPNTGTQYFNYKKYFSIVLLAVSDADYCFTVIDVGAYGRDGDSNNFKSSFFGRRLAYKQLNLPGNKPLSNTISPSLPHVFVADEAFGLSENVLRPYSRNNLSLEERVFNYRLIRARRYVECSFGILANKWRVFHTNILVAEDFATDITKAACVLHNFIRRRDGVDVNDGSFCNMEDIPIIGTGGPSTGIAVRDKFKEYFLSEAGKLSYQYDKI